MHNHQAFYQLKASERAMMMGHVINPAVDRSACTAEHVSIFRKEITMHAHQQITVSGTHTAVGRARDVKRWCPPLRDWWATRNTARREVRRVSLHAYWDAKHEAVTPVRADPALEMAIAHEALSMAMQPYSLIQ
jgi:hypothetical protein